MTIRIQTVRTIELVQGQIFIADDKAFQNATVKVELIDTSTNRNSDLLASVELSGQSRPADGYLPFEIRAVHIGGDTWDMARAYLEVSIEIDGKLAYANKYSQPLSISGPLPVHTTVVVHPV